MQPTCDESVQKFKLNCKHSVLVMHCTHSLFSHTEALLGHSALFKHSMQPTPGLHIDPSPSLIQSSLFMQLVEV